MIIFILILFLLIILTFFKQSFFSKVMFLLSLVCLALIAGFRNYSIGTDTLSYLDSFNSQGKVIINSIYDLFFNENGYYFLQHIVKSAGYSFTVLLLIIALVSISCIGLIINKYSSNVFLSLIIYISMGYYFFSMAGLRQTIALSIFLIALMFLLNEKRLFFIVLVIVAMFFHKTVLITLPLFFITKKNNIKYYVLFTILCSLLCYFFSDRLLSLAIKLIWGNQRYSQNEYGGISTLILLTIISTLSVIILYDKNHMKEGINHFILKIVMISIPFQVLAIFQANAFRISMYFNILTIVLIPNMITQFEIKYRFKNLDFLIKIGVLLLLLIQFFAFTSKTADILPFQFV